MKGISGFLSYKFIGFCRSLKTENWKLLFAVIAVFLLAALPAWAEAEIAIATTSNAELEPAIASNGTTYLIVWHEDSGEDSDLKGALIRASDGVMLASNINISAATGMQLRAAVAYTGTDYLVVWMDNRLIDGIGFHIYGARVRASDGVVLDMDGFIISSPLSEQGEPAVACDGTNCLVVWTDNRNYFALGSGWDIYGARVRVSDAAVLDEITISTLSNTNEGAPSVAFNGTNYMIAWGGYNFLYAARVTPDGTVLDSPAIVATDDLGDQGDLSLASDGTDFFVAFRRSEDIYGIRVSSTGVILDPSGILIAAGANIQREASAIFDGIMYVVAWHEYYGSDGNWLEGIHSAKVSTSGIVLSPSGSLLSDQSSSAQYEPVMSHSNFNTIVVWRDYRNGNWDIYGRIFGAGAIDLPRTGQTTSYAPGDDGDIQAGVAWPNPRFTDNGDQTITDNLTGLIWTKDAGTPTVGSCTGGIKTWQGALDYVSCLNSNSHLGHNDWRLPNINELEGLIDKGRADTKVWLNAQGFRNIQNATWSSTTCPWRTNAALYVFLHSGGSITETLKSSSVDVWPVRSMQPGVSAHPKTGQTQCYDSAGTEILCAGTGQDGSIQAGVAWPVPRFTDNGDQTIMDHLTGLMWTKDANAPGPSACSPGTTKIWQDALDYVSCLNTNSYLGHNDWRLPNFNELTSLLNLAVINSDGWLSAQGFINTIDSTMRLCTSTTLAELTDGVLVGSLRGSGSVSKVDLNYVWPVRGGTVSAGAGKIVFISQNASGSDVYVMNADGTNKTRLTYDSASDWNPSFSPDGTKIAFNSYRDGNPEIYMMNADGTNQTRLTYLTGGWPRFSPDGTKIVFASLGDIYSINIDGTNQTRITHGMNAGEPSFSPDGSKIVFTAMSTMEVYIMNADGSDPTRLAGGYYPTFSPDGSKIAHTYDAEIYITNADGTNQTRLTNNPGVDKHASFSPDGSRIVFTFNDSEIYVMNVDGSNQVNITNSVESDYEPFWGLGSVPASDTIPAPFDFAEQTGVALNTQITSNSITVSGINAPTPISITGGEYSINGELFTSASGTVNNGDSVRVRQTSSGSYSTTTITTLTIGGVNDTFSVTTIASFDLCPSDPDKTVPGICGCGVVDTDSDSDGVPDCIDGCPNDPDKVSPGVSGCGTLDTTVPPGTGIIVAPAPSVTLDFSSVASGGNITVTELSHLSLPAYFSVVGKAYDITTTASFTGLVTVCFGYDDTGMTLEQEDNLQLLHFKNDTWSDITTSRHPAINRLCGITDSLSPFVIVLRDNLASPPLRFNWYRGNGCYEINFDATMNQGTTFAWNFGDGIMGSGKSISHAYTSAGSYSVTLTADGNRQRTMVVHAMAKNQKPDASMSVSIDTSDPTGMTLKVTDASTDNSCSGAGLGTATVLWGDGATVVKGISPGNEVGSHKYHNPGTYTIRYSFKDSENNKAMSSPYTVTVPDAATSTYTVSGTICAGANNGDGDCSDAGESPVFNATIYLKSGQSIVKMGKTDMNGYFEIKNVSVNSTDSYSVVPQKSGYTFSPASATVSKGSPAAYFVGIP